MSSQDVVIELHTQQHAVEVDRARFKVLSAGRRWGKTRYGVIRCISVAANPSKFDPTRGGRAWWVAPSFPIASIGWRMMKDICDGIDGTKVREGERAIHFPGGGWIMVRSADNPDSLRGEGLDYVVFDEAAFMSEEAWKVMRPALSDRKGGALFISTPKGRNWFWGLFTRGEDELRPLWSCFNFPTVGNPLIDQAEVEEAKEDLPESTFRQEYMASFEDDNAGVFRKVNACATGILFTKPYNGQFVMGVDWGASEDFTVCVVMDVKTKSVVDFDRFQKIDFKFQRNRLLAMYMKWTPGAIIVEANSIGLPNFEALREEGLPVQAWWATNATKTAIIQQLAFAMETAGISYPVIGTLMNELISFQSERTISGGLRFSAPDGSHDDCVIALALAYEACRSEGTSRESENSLRSIRGQTE